MKTRIRMTPSTLVRPLLILILILIGLALCGVLLAPQEGAVQTVFAQFSLSSERTPPAFFSFLLLLICSLCLGAIALHEHQTGSRWRRHWTALGVMFVLLSYDEAAGVHEKAIEPLREMLGVGGVFYYAWVIPGIIVVAVIFFAYLPFLLALPRRFGALFLIAGAVYVGGAIGMEMISGWQMDEHGRGLTYRLITIVEETFEMLGAVLFIYSLMKYLAHRAGAFELQVELTGPAAATAARAMQAPAPAAALGLSAARAASGTGAGAVGTAPRAPAPLAGPQ